MQSAVDRGEHLIGRGGISEEVKCDQSAPSSFILSELGVLFVVNSKKWPAA